MVQQYEASFTYKIKYETEVPVPLKDIISALESLDILLKNTSSIISELSHVEVLGHQIYVQKIESGSLIEDIVVKVIFGDKDKLDEFLLWLHKTNMKNILIGVLLGSVLTYGVTVLLHNNSAAGNNSGSQIINSPNSMIINFPSGAIDEKVIEQVNQAVSKNISNKNEVAKQTLNFFEPTRNDPKASVSMGNGSDKITIPATTVKEIPLKYSPKKNNRFEDLNGIEIKLRATDLDNKKSGWAGTIEGVTGRIKIELDPTLDPNDLYGKSKVIADVTLERDFSSRDNKLIPKRIIIRAIH